MPMSPTEIEMIPWTAAPTAAYRQEVRETFENLYEGTSAFTIITAPIDSLVLVDNIQSTGSNYVVFPGGIVGVPTWASTLKNDLAALGWTSNKHTGEYDPEDPSLISIHVVARSPAALAQVM